MFTRMIWVIFLIFALSGCATSSKKQAIQPQPVVSEKPQKTYQQESEYNYDDIWLSDAYEKPVKKTYPEATIQLTPKQIQRALKSAGFYQGPIDGKIGPKTKEAIVKFQRSKGLKADGIVGKKTSAELNKYLSQ